MEKSEKREKKNAFVNVEEGENEMDRMPQAMGGSAEVLHFPENDAEYDVDSSDEDLDGMEAGESVVRSFHFTLVDQLHSIAFRCMPLHAIAFPFYSLYIRQRVLTRLNLLQVHEHAWSDARGVYSRSQNVCGGLS